MNEQVRETVEQLEKLFQKVHEGVPERVSHIRKNVAPLLPTREGEILKDVVSDEVARHQGKIGSPHWSSMVRSDALYRTALWTKVAERAIASEGAP
jgi:hypothetical protein